MAESVGEMLALACFGDTDIVVAFVVAVLGLSPVAEDIAAAEEEGNFPVSSSFLIRDFRSSSSSQTVDGAVVDIVESVASRARYFERSATSSRPRALLAAPGAALVALLKYRCLRGSSSGCADAADVCQPSESRLVWWAGA
jgi:hypothetical protein